MSFANTCSIGFRSGEYGEVKQACSDRRDGLADACHFVGGKVVHHDDVPGLEAWCEDPFDVGAEHVTRHWTVEHKGGDDPALARECRNFRVWAAIVDPMEVPDGSTQVPSHT